MDDCATTGAEINPLRAGFKPSIGHPAADFQETAFSATSRTNTSNLPQTRLYKLCHQRRGCARHYLLRLEDPSAETIDAFVVPIKHTFQDAGKREGGPEHPYL
jgi:hypothetical protein